MKKSLLSLGLASVLSVVSVASFADSAVMNDVTTGIEAKTGKEIYQTVCISCHMAEGKGAKGAGQFPAFANNMRLMAAEYPAYIVLYGQKGMPGFGNYLDDDQIAAIVNYIRTSFGNDFKPDFTPEQVAKMRKPDADYGTLD
ncbi:MULTISPECIES: c-type cytochrome [Paenalcaligenes]|uniref:Cytochrome c domain-containing protein n=1 Tax=Paenalcaligenes hermetiae TaxID=1157987 RepID=A0ABP9LVX6_9BURK|nr:cytochrome c [Paenalcaligenes sp.]